MRAQHLTRQLDLIPLDKLGMPVTIIGAGAVGSWVALALAKMGMSDIIVWDDDVVDVENLNCQFYPRASVGELKVNALANMVRDFTGIEIGTADCRWDESAIPREGIVISAVDSMEARAAIWQAHKISPTSWLIDPRMAAEMADLYVVKLGCPTDAEDYQKTLHTDADSVQERCTAKATIYTANLLAGLVSKAVKDLITGNPYARVTTWHIGNHAVKMWPSS